MAELEGEQLKKALEVLFNFLEKKQLLPTVSNNKKNDIIDKVFSCITENNISIDPEKLFDKSMQNTLAHAIISSSITSMIESSPDLLQKMGGNTFDFDLKYLFKNQFELENDLKKNPDELKNEYKKTLTALNKLEPNPEKRLTEEEIEELAQGLVDKQINDLPEALESEKFLQPVDDEAFDEMLTATLINVCGGDDPRMPGIHVALETVVGNLTGMLDEGASTNRDAILDIGSRVDDDPDYVGIKTSNKTHSISIGAMSPELEVELENAHFLKPANEPAYTSPYAIKPPHPPGFPE